MSKKKLIDMFKLNEIEGKVTHEKIKEKIRENIDRILNKKEIEFTSISYLISENNHTDAYYDMASDIIGKMVESLNNMDVESFENFKSDADSLDISYSIDVGDENCMSFFYISKFNRALSQSIIDYIVTKEITHQFCDVLFKVLNDRKCA